MEQESYIENGNGKYIENENGKYIEEQKIYLKVENMLYNVFKDFVLKYFVLQYNIRLRLLILL